MGKSLDWLEDNWCYSCKDAHEEPCDEYLLRKEEIENQVERKHRDEVNSIDTISDLCCYIENQLFSPFRLEKR